MLSDHELVQADRDTDVSYNLSRSFYDGMDCRLREGESAGGERGGDLMSSDW